MKHALDLAVGARGWGYGLEMFPSGRWRNGVRGCVRRCLGHEIHDNNKFYLGHLCCQ